MYIITGGAGFIGSNIAYELEKLGADIVIVDVIRDSYHKWRNISKRRIYDFIFPDDICKYLENNKSKIEAIIHMGAISTTTETNVDNIIKNNLRLSIDLWNFCTKNKTPFVYASSAATYGDGSFGFEDNEDVSYLTNLQPLNPYGWSKHTFDRFIINEKINKRELPPRWVGLKFFNVYGPNEYHKENQRSVAVQVFEQIRDRGSVSLFKSDNIHYADGAQERDFVWVGDCVQAVLWGIDEQHKNSGIFNVGSGKAQTFNQLAIEVFNTLNKPVNIHYIDLPENLKGKYQYHTEAKMDKLHNAGCAIQSTSLEKGVNLYLKNFLELEDIYR